MKFVIILVSITLIGVVGGLQALTGTSSTGWKAAEGNADKPSDAVTWEVPIAAGIWYPTDGPIPEKPARYYRVRCWPGCHTGSTYGKYPDKTLHDRPIWPTSTINVHSINSKFND
jgi:hypothetical protein